MTFSLAHPRQATPSGLTQQDLAPAIERHETPLDKNDWSKVVHVRGTEASGERRVRPSLSLLNSPLSTPSSRRLEPTSKPSHTHVHFAPQILLAYDTTPDGELAYEHTLHKIAVKGDHVFIATVLPAFLLDSAMLSFAPEYSLGQDVELLRAMK